MTKHRATGKTPAALLLLGAVGVVFGDIGTSPLYAMKVIFGSNGLQLDTTPLVVHGILSLIIWTIIIVVCIKYIGFVMKADNKGEGGIMALIARVNSRPLTSAQKRLFIGIGLVGAALFYGDSAITPAVSVLSAVEGVKIAVPSLSDYIIQLTVVILVGLFWLQRYGTAVIGKLFGPVMFTWFLVLAWGGLRQITHHPEILQALSPRWAVDFIAAMPMVAFLSMGAVILAVTGVEALFADMGHFGRGPIARAWLFFVFPSLVLCYMGQAALILSHPGTAADPFFLLFPEAVHLPVLLLAMAATLIASQAVITGAFSLTRQAVQLGFLPRLTVRHTSASETGQVYVPFVNFLLLVAVILCVVIFGSSVKLAGAYGMAVAGALAVDTLLFFVVMMGSWRRPLNPVVLASAVFVIVDIVLVTSNAGKLLHGGWLPLSIAALVLLLISTWRRGEHIIRGERHYLESPLEHFVANMRAHKFGRVNRLQGKAIYIGHHPGKTPLALHATVENMHELHKRVVIVYVTIAETAHVPEAKRAKFDGLSYKDGISELTLTFGFHDVVNIPRTLQGLRQLDPELDFDPDTAAYFISQNDIALTNRKNMAHWRKVLYMMMERNGLGPTMYYHLPIERTTEMRVLLRL
jgi:KUP system potassium uptake protein